MSAPRSYVSAGLVSGLIVVPVAVAFGIPAYLSGHTIAVFAGWTALSLAPLALSLRGLWLTHVWDRTRVLAAVGMTIGAAELICAGSGLLIVIVHPPALD